MVSRQCAPGIGATQEGGAYLKKGQWQISTTYRQLVSDDHYNGINEQTGRHADGTYVINKQKILDFNGTYAVNERFNVSLSVPYLAHGSWSIPLPLRPVRGPRFQQDSHGIGDIILTGRYWMLDTQKHPKQNISFGVGIKAPTGEHDRTDMFPDINGANIQQRAVDQSIQPGDGGWGILLDTQMFKAFGRTTAFVTGTYLLNPRDTNGTPSIRATLGLPPDPVRPSLQVNSVPDQYVFRAGVLRPIGKKGLTGSLAWRIEGVPPSDLIGDSNGFRRPGYATSIEPGLIYSRGKSTFSLNVPITLVRNRQKTRADNAPSAGDATFADHVLLLNYTRRF